MLDSADDSARGAGAEASGAERVAGRVWRALGSRAAAVRRWFGEAPVCIDQPPGGTPDDETDLLDEMAVW